MLVGNRVKEVDFCKPGRGEPCQYAVGFAAAKTEPPAAV